MQLIKMEKTNDYYLSKKNNNEYLENIYNVEKPILNEVIREIKNTFESYKIDDILDQKKYIKLLIKDLENGAIYE